MGHWPVLHLRGVDSGVYCEKACQMSDDVEPGCVRLIRYPPMPTERFVVGVIDITELAR